MKGTKVRHGQRKTHDGWTFNVPETKTGTGGTPGGRVPMGQGGKGGGEKVGQPETR